MTMHKAFHLPHPRAFARLALGYVFRVLSTEIELLVSGCKAFRSDFFALPCAGYMLPWTGVFLRESPCASSTQYWPVQEQEDNADGLPVRIQLTENGLQTLVGDVGYCLLQHACYLGFG